MIKRLSSYALLALPLIVPAIVMAASQGLVPCGVSDIPDIATECQACNFVQLVQNVIQFIIVLSVPTAAALFAYAGAKLVFGAGKPGAREAAKKIITTTAVGFVIALSCWVVVNTVIYLLVNKNFFPGSTWFSIQCVPGADRNRSALLPGIISNQLVPGSTTGGNGGGSGESTAGGTIGLPVQGSDGQTHLVSFGVSRSDLSSTYTHVESKYGSQIQTACSQYGSAIPDCERTVGALITVESSGQGVNVMQVNSSNGGSNCTDTACNIATGVRYLNQVCTQTGGNLSNCIAAYNSGPSTIPGTSVSGKNPALAPSNDCPGLDAWQCGTNPGNLTVTQQEVANTCMTIYLAHGSC